MAAEVMESGKSLVIDNTNPKKDIRKDYISVAKKYSNIYHLKYDIISKDYPVRCFYFDISKDIAFHLNELRKVNIIRPHLSSIVPDVLIHFWFKNVQKPNVNINIYMYNFSYSRIER